MKLFDHCELVMTAAEMQDRSVWLNARAEGIGGSDAACIVGLNPWKSQYQLWLEKTGEAEAEDISDKDPVHFGQILEKVVADEFCQRENKKVKRCGLYRNKELPWMLGSFDRLVIGEEAGLECKTTNSFNRSAWDSGEIPPQYYVQCQHYMAVSGLPRWYIAALIGGNHYACWTIERDEEDIAALREAEIEFWKKVKHHIVPDIDGSDSCTEALRKKYKGGNVEPVPLPEESLKLIKRIEELKLVETDIKGQIQKLQNQICQILGDNEVGTIGTGDDARIVSWKTTAGRTTIDSKKLKADMPEVFEKYSKTSAPSRRFSIKTPKTKGE